MLSAIDGAQGDLNKMQASLEAWYDSSMDRVSGWYKRSTQWVLFFIGILVAVGLNINTLTIIDYFSHNEAARSIVVQKATAAAKDPSTTTDKNYTDTKKDLDDLGLPIGWTNDWGAPRKGDGPWFNVFGPVLGWLFTALAATLGAPFWFDMLNKVMVVRSTVKPNQKSPNEASEDRQLPQQPQPQQPPIVNNIVQPLTNDIVPNNVQIPPGQSPAPADKDTDIDGCDVAVTDVTTDEALPVSEGGVA
jgi:hypothetical protein